MHTDYGDRRDVATAIWRGCRLSDDASEALPQVKALLGRAESWLAADDGPTGSR
jgi:hypothetical protein